MCALVHFFMGLSFDWIFHSRAVAQSKQPRGLPKWQNKVLGAIFTTIVGYNFYLFWLQLLPIGSVELVYP